MPWEGAEQPVERQEASSAVWEGDADQKRRYPWQQARPGDDKTAKARPPPRRGRLRAGMNRNSRVKRIAQRISKQSSP